MRLSQILSNRFTLLLGGTGALLLGQRNGRMTPILTARAGNPPELAALAAAMTARRRTPVNIVLDLADMNFRRETVPVVGLLDRAKVLRRRLDMVFPEVKLRGALPIGDSTGGGGRREQPHLFAAVSNASDWAQWREWLLTLPNPKASMGLLPLEVLDMAQALRRGPDGDDKVPADAWTLLICQQWSGGIRQVVLRGDNLVLTRMTPVGPTVPATDIIQEIRATLGYLARLEFSGRARIQVLGIGPEDWNEAILASGLPVASSRIMGCDAAAALLQLDMPASDAGPAHADAITLLWAARRTAPVMDVTPEAWRRHSQMEAGARLATLVATAGLATAGIVALQDGWTLMERYRQIQETQAAIADLSARRETTMAELVGKAIDPRMASAATHYADQWQRMPNDPSGLLDGLIQALPPDIRVDKLTWVVPDGGKARAEIELLLNGGQSARQAMDQAEALRQRLADAFPDATVLLSKPPVPVLLSVMLDSGPGNAQEHADGYPATIVMEGTR